MPQKALHEELVLKFNQGENHLFNHLYKSLYADLTKHALGLIQDKMQAEDIVAETFLKLSALRSRFITYESILAFIYSTIKNACFNFIRDRKCHNAINRKISYLTKNDIDSLPDQATDPAIYSMLHKEIEKLPKKEKEILKLYFFLGMTYTEIVEIMGCSCKETARSTKTRALKNLRGRLLATYIFASRISNAI